MHGNLQDVLPVDLNNDGFCDLAVLREGNVHLYRNEVYRHPVFGMRNRLVEVNNVNLIQNGMGVSNHLSYGDFNGDGVIDLLFSGGLASVFLSDGSFGFMDQYLVPSPATALTDPIVIDYDNDGRSDLLCVNEKFKRIAWLRSLGKAFATDWEFETNHCPGAGQIAVGDFDGDGRKDVICAGGSLLRDEETQGLYRYRMCQPYAVGKVKSVTDGIGVIGKMDYRPLTDSTIYNTTSFVDSTGRGLMEIREPLCVLSSMTVRTPYGQPLRDETYHYSGGIRDNRGRGFLGFLKVETHDRLNAKKITENSMFNLSTGGPCLFPFSETIALESGDLISKRTMKYTPFLLATGACCRWLSSSTDYDYLAGTSVKTTTLIDLYGNLTQKYTVYADNSYERDVYEYMRVYAWCPDRPASLRRTTKNNGEKQIKQETNWDYNVGARRMKTVFYKGTAMELSCDQIWNERGLTLSKSMTDGIDTLTMLNRYDEKGRLIHECDYQGMVRQFQYDTWSQCVSENSAFGERSFEYDGFGNLKKETDIYGKNRKYFRTPSNVAGIAYYEICKGDGLPTQIRGIDHSGREVMSGWGSYGNRMICQNRVYDRKGMLEYVSVPYYDGDGEVRIERSYQYDVFGRLISERNYLDDSSTDYAYSGLETTITTPTSVRRELRNARGWVVENEWNGKKVGFEYNSAGCLLAARPDGSPAIQFAYDIQGNRTSIKDPDAGEIHWTYDAFGRIRRESKLMNPAADSVCTEFSYQNGWLQKKQIGDRTEQFVYERGLLVSDRVNGVFALYNQYDPHGNLIQKTLEMGDTLSYVTSYVYDDYGRQVSQIFPSGLEMTYDYDQAGFLTGSRFPEGNGAWHHVSSDVYNRTTGENTGFLTKTLTYVRNGSVKSESCPGVMDYQYSYGADGLLYIKKDGLSEQSAVYEYDNMERLKHVDLLSKDTVSESSLQYDERNNLLYKSDLGDFPMEYNSESPHAVTGIDGIPSAMNFSDMDITYMPFGKVSSIDCAGINYRLYYGPQDQRIRSVTSTGNKSEVHDYVDKYEEITESDGNIRKIHYLCHDSGVWGIYVRNTQRNDSMYYAWTEYQHNLVALTDSSGNVVRRYAYDPWGGRRMPDNWSVPDTTGGRITSRGFSSHEHLDGFDFINMNGRMYDPVTSQFLSPDLTVQDPSNWLNFNRYAYCYGNPLKYWDPSGYYISDATALVGMSYAINSGATVTDEGVYQLPSGDYRFNTVDVSSSGGSYEVTVTAHGGDTDGMYLGSRFSGNGMYGQSSGGWYEQYRQSWDETILQQSMYNERYQKQIQQQEIMTISAWAFASGVGSAVGGLNEGMGVLGGKGYTYGSNGKFYASGWRGNGYVSTTKVGKIGSLGAGATAVGVLCEVPEVVEGYKKDGYQVGYNFGKEFAGGVGSLGGSTAGALLGAKVGAFAPPYGPLIGGVVGGVLGGIFGESGVEYVYDLFMKP